MKDNLSIVISMIIFVILIVIFPLYNYFERQDDMSYNLALKTTTNFVDEVTESGYLDQDTYDRFVEELSDTGNVYDIQLEAHKRIKTDDGTGTDTYDEQYLIDYNEQIFDTTTGSISANLNERTIKGNSYVLEEGDMFYVKLKNSNTTMAGAIFNTIVPSSKKDRIVVNYGGIIKNQAWSKVDATYRNLLKSSTAPNVEYLATGESNPVSINTYQGATLNFKASGPNATNNNWWDNHSAINNWKWELKKGDDTSSVANGITNDGSFNFSITDAGEYTLFVRGVDSAGYTTDPNKITITVVPLTLSEGYTTYSEGKKIETDNQRDFDDLNFELPNLDIGKRPRFIILDVYAMESAFTDRDSIMLSNSSNITVGGRLKNIYYKNFWQDNKKIQITFSRSKFDEIKNGSLEVENIIYNNVDYHHAQYKVSFNYGGTITDEEINNFFKDLKVEYNWYWLSGENKLTNDNYFIKINTESGESKKLIYSTCKIMYK